MNEPEHHPHHWQRRKNSWFWRRLLVYAIVTFCMTMLTWLAWNGVQDGKLHAIIAEGCMWLLVAVYLTYVVGATTDDLISLVNGVRGIAQEIEEKK